jgi:virulence factor Mce-like protein
MSQLDPRKRLTSGITRSRLQAEARKASRPTVLFIVGIILTGGIASYLLTNISSVFGHGSYEVRFAVNEDYGVFAGFDDVRFRGVPAGTITKVQRDGARLILVAKIRKDKGIVYQDARAQIRPITPLNDVYLDVVDPGTPAAGRAKPGRPLTEAQTQTSVSVPDVLNVFDADVRQSTARLLDQLGNGMADGGAKLNRAFIALGPFLRQAGDLTRQVALHDATTKRLIHNTAVLTTELGRRDTELKRLVKTGAATVGTLQQHSGDLDSTLAQLGPTFTELRSSLASVRGVVDDVDAGLASLNPVATKLPGALASVRSLNRTLGPAIAQLQQPVKTLTPFVGRLRQVADRLEPIATALRPQVPTLNRLTQRLVSCEKGVIGFFQWNTSLAKFGDANGPVLRGNLAVGVPSTGLPGESLRTPEAACTPGPVVRGVPLAKDGH